MSDGVYRALLVAYPREFRREYGEHMVQGFRDLLRDERHRGFAALAAFWVRVVLDVISSAFAERRAAHGGLLLRSPGLARWSGAAVVLGGVLLLAQEMLWRLLGRSEEPTIGQNHVGMFGSRAEQAVDALLLGPSSGARCGGCARRCRWCL